MPRHVVSTLLGLVGATIGGVLGYWAFFAIVRQGFYALVLPGALVGMGCGLLAQHRSFARGIVCGLAGLVLGLYTDWGFEKFNADRSFQYFATHFYKLEPVTLFMIAAGGLIAFWTGKDAGYASFGGRRSPPSHQVKDQG
jgi:hypothetical protein